MLVYINGSTLESRMDRLESKIDRIIEYLEEPPAKTPSVTLTPNKKQQRVDNTKKPHGNPPHGASHILT